MLSSLHIDASKEVNDVGGCRRQSHRQGRAWLSPKLPKPVNYSPSSQAEEVLDEALGEERIHHLLAAAVPDTERRSERRRAQLVELIHQQSLHGVHQAVERA